MLSSHVTYLIGGEVGAPFVRASLDERVHFKPTLSSSFGKGKEAIVQSVTWVDDTACKMGEGKVGGIQVP
jgi:hypothetical protein